MDRLIVPSNSLLLVTGVNGFLGSHTADQFLSAGYRVRGTVRDKSRCQWLAPFFSSKYGSDRFELIEISDFAISETYGAALKDVAGIAHMAGPADLSAIAAMEAEQAVSSGVEGALTLLRAAENEKSVRAFVLTSSQWALYTPQPNVKINLTVSSYNESGASMAFDKNLPPDFKGMATYMAVKTRIEQACWEWVRQENPSFTFNSILPGIVFGPALSPRDEGIRSTAAFIKLLWEGENVDFLKKIPPQWFIDVRDNGRLHLGALILPGVDRERILGFAERYNWNTVLASFRNLYPEKRDFVQLPDLGWDQAEVPNQRGEEVLRLLGYKGWTTLGESVHDNVESFVN